MIDGLNILPKPFSFIRWEECYHDKYDYFCQEIWEWSEFLNLYPPHMPARWPWTNDPARYDVPTCGENTYYQVGSVSVWALLSSEIPLEDYFVGGEDYDGVWEPLDCPLFWDDLGFILDSCADDYSTANEPVPITVLLDTLPYPSRLSPPIWNEIIDSCTRRSIKKATGLFLLFNYDYCGTPVFGRFCSGLVEFVGSFSCDTSTGSDSVNSHRQITM